MTVEWHDILGTLGVALIVFAYASIQFSWLRAETYLYSGINGLGALLILVSLIYKFNFAAFLMEAVWLALSIYGIARKMRGAPQG